MELQERQVGGAMEENNVQMVQAAPASCAARE
jgi:hypothetical protein